MLVGSFGVHACLCSYNRVGLPDSSPVSSVLKTQEQQPGHLQTTGRYVSFYPAVSVFYLYRYLFCHTALSCGAVQFI